MSEKFDTDLDQLEVDKKIYEQAIQNLYNTRDLLACLPDHGYIQIGVCLNAVDQAINATEAYGDRFLEDV
tara:strand:+ start:200 stop:409 length:210 start_codon:yes stop_codon:yes gene_type:complete